MCVANEELNHPLSVALTLDQGDFSLDITHTHLFIGYKPLIIGLIIPADTPDDIVRKAPVICLSFHQQSFSINSRWHGFNTDKDCVAKLLLKRIEEKKLGDTMVLFFEGIDGSHSFIHPLYQSINNLRERFRKNDPGNVSLPGKLYDMVRIAYAVPRIISLITVNSGQNMNMFPTDLHGAVSEKFYISSLRKGGKATEQVEQVKKLTLSDIDAREYKFAYSLGKNHMQDLRNPEHFSCAAARSHQFDMPLPFAVTRYRELNQTGSFDVGIHRVHLYETVHEQRIARGNTLAHIHQYYAQWRMENDLPTNFLLR